MRVKIGSKVYDTARAQEVGRQTVSFFGDPYGFEEIMFQKDGREYFLLVKGGECSQYKEEQIIPLNLQDAREWLMRITGEDHANYLIPQEDLEEAPAPSKPVKKPATKKPVAKKATTKQTKAQKSEPKKAAKKSASTQSAKPTAE